MYRRGLLTMTGLLVALLAVAEAGVCPVKQLQVERLPSLNTPRAGHYTFVVNGELTVVGGHTSGFVPTATAEYLSEGSWHQLNTIYTHDQGFCLPMSDGRVMLAGGHEKDLGIGQVFSVEIYHPCSHRFEGYGCLDTKRCFADAVELDSGHVAITGNWYEDDAIELYKGERLFSFLKKVTQQRTQPFILRTAKDNAIIFSTIDIHGQQHDTIVIDRLKGEPFTLPFLDIWRPRRIYCIHRNQDSFIGDATAERYSYLITVEDSTRQMAVARTEGEDFRLLPTTTPIPMECNGLPIDYFTSVIADRKAQRGYIVGVDSIRHFYVLAIDYNEEPASLTLYQTAPQDSMGMSMPVVMPNGDLAIVGGTTESNFTPNSSALLLKTGTQGDAIIEQNASGRLWLWVAIGIMTLILLLTCLLFRKRKAHQEATEPARSLQPSEDSQLMQRICQLMDEQKPYLNADLKLQDIASLLHTNRTYISNSIKATHGQTFTQFVNIYRVDFAKELMCRQPSKKMSAVAAEAGFTTETSFFRTFKAVTGTTPSEWKAKQAIIN